MNLSDDQYLHNMPAIAPKPEPDARHDLASIGPQKPEIIAPNLADLMICILATGLAMALIRLHMEEPTLKFRFRSGAPLSVSTRLFLGHFMTAIGLVLGLSRLAKLLAQKNRQVRFGNFFWAVTGVYLAMHLLASIGWATVHQLSKTTAGNAALPLSTTFQRVALLTSHQACFDELAWLFAAIWISGGLLSLFSKSQATDEFIAQAPLKSDLSFALYSGLVISATVFQRIFEATGF